MGSYLEAVGVIGGMGMRNKADLYQKGSGIFRKLPPVALAQEGKEVGEKDRNRVFTFKPDPIRQLRKKVAYYL